MKKTENHCCGCAVPGYPCRDCGLKRVEVYYCDKCKEEIDDDVYESDGEELCEYCLLKKYRKEF